VPDVRLVNLVKTFEKGRIVAVDHVNLHVYDKEYLTLLGPSGCGKTTTLKLIAGLMEADEGEIYIGNRLVTNVSPEDRNIGYVFQEYALFPHMDVWDNVTYGPRVKAWEEKQRVTVGREMLEMVRLYERADAFPQELSGGMQQRVALARALAAGANLLLLDEPLGALDAKIRFDLRYELRKLVKDLGLTAIHVTHDQAEAMAISDRIAVMRKGKILQVGTPQELYLNPKHIFVAHFVGESNFLEGFIVKVGSKDSIVELRGGLKIKVNDVSRSKGEKVVLAIRPEAFSIGKRSRKTENLLHGTVERVSFEGTNIRYEVRLENEDLIIIMRPSLLEKWLEAGEKILVSFPPDKCHVFPYPSAGLTEELAVE